MEKLGRVEWIILQRVRCGYLRASGFREGYENREVGGQGIDGQQEQGEVTDGESEEGVEGARVHEGGYAPQIGQEGFDIESP